MFRSSVKNDHVDTADCTFRVVGACLIIAEKKTEEEREKEKRGRQRKRTLKHSITTMQLSVDSLSQAQSAQERLQMAAAFPFHLPSIDSDNPATASPETQTATDAVN